MKVNRKSDCKIFSDKKQCLPNVRLRVSGKRIKWNCFPSLSNKHCEICHKKSLIAQAIFNITIDRKNNLGQK